jgi:predicted dehydrogenase
MGKAHLNLLAKHKQLNLAYVCDVDETRLKDAAKIATDAGHTAVKAEKDLRKVLEDKAVNAVWMATPDHWHSPGAILAADAGKHVYVEKPCSHNVREGRLMIEASAR